jgi:DnaJ family protein C protein 19
MIQLISLIIIATIFILVIRNLQNASAADRRKGYWRLGLIVMMVILVVLVITGRMHWIGALLGALLPLAKILFNIFMEKFIRDKVTPSSPTMSLDEARAILGVSASATRDEIELAYKALIQKLHPDRGGNDFLASQLNNARELLLSTFNETI